MADGYVTVRCLKFWRDQRKGLAYAAGQEFKATEGHAKMLFRAAPESFEIVRAKAKAVRRPAKNKMVESAPEDK